MKSLAAVAYGFLGLSALASPGPVQPKAELPVTRVTLFSSGVGYFQREGEVEGDARVDLIFPASDVNDLLKSLIVQDAGGGRVGTVTYVAFRMPFTILTA